MLTKAILEPWKSFFTVPLADVDVLPIASNAAERLIRIAGQGSTLHRRHKVYIQVGVAPVPINYQERLTEMFPVTFSRMRLMGLDPYDLALSKLERNTQRDRDDVKHLSRIVPFDVKVLEERYHTELRADLGNPRREDLTLNFGLR